MNIYVNAALAGLVTALVLVTGFTMMNQALLAQMAATQSRARTSRPAENPMLDVSPSRPVWAYVVEIDETGRAPLPAPRHSTPFCVATGADVRLTLIDMAQIRIEPPPRALAMCAEPIP